MGEILSIEQRMAEAQQRFGVVLKRKTRDEACGSCPICGGTDRWVCWANGRYMCRPGQGHCGMEGWLDEEDATPITKERILELRVQALELKQREHEQRIKRLEEMAKCKDHLTYHQALDDDAKGWWYEQGIFDGAIADFQLGYCAECPTAPGDSYTIPVHSFDGTLVDIQHRLVNASNGDKYRPHKAGLGSHLFGAHLLGEKHYDRICILEGSKKAIVFNQYGFPSVAVRSCQGRFQREWLTWLLNSTDSVVVVFDPDALEHAMKLGEGLARNGFEKRVRVANFCVKPDDAITHYGARACDVEATLRLGRPV